jgi:multidrug transporter EmrE-like cation transporter
MWYLIGAILLNVLGFFMGSSSYLLENNTTAYALGTASSVAFLIGFLLLEYALYNYSFGTVFIAWGAGMAALLALAGIFFWGEATSAINTGFIILTLLGVSSLIASDSKNYF